MSFNECQQRINYSLFTEYKFQAMGHWNTCDCMYLFDILQQKLKLPLFSPSFCDAKHTEKAINQLCIFAKNDYLQYAKSTARDNTSLKSLYFQHKKTTIQHQ